MSGPFNPMQSGETLPLPLRKRGEVARGTWYEHFSGTHWIPACAGMTDRVATAH